MSDTRISWTNKTWNPLVGCSRTSPGCDRCYAIGVAHRAMQPAHRGLTLMTEHGADWTGEVRCLPDRLTVPETWRRPCLVFVNSMSDLFHRDVPPGFIVQVFATMALTPRHTYQVLTKRAQRMAKWTSDPTNQCLVNVEVAHRLGIRTAHFAPIDSSAAARRLGAAIGDARVAAGLERYSTWPLPNVWLGVSVESQRYANLRLPHLLSTHTAVRWVSAEPLLGRLDLGIGDPHRGHLSDDVHGHPHPRTCLTCSSEDHDVPYFRRDPGHSGIDWVVAGGESGPGARPMDLEWARSLRDQCCDAGVPFFMKQLGAVRARELGAATRAGHALDELPGDLQIRELPEHITTGDVR